MILGILLFGLSVGVGIYLKTINQNKLKFKLDLLNFCDYLKTQISFNKKPLKEIVENYIENATPELKNILKDYEESFTASTLFVVNSNILDFEEKQMLNELFGRLGRSDITGQIELCDNTKQFLNKNYEIWSVKHKKNGDICLKLSICFGILLIILVI